MYFNMLDMLTRSQDFSHTVNLASFLALNSTFGLHRTVQICFHVLSYTLEYSYVKTKGIFLMELFIMCFHKLRLLLLHKIVLCVNSLLSVCV